MEETEKQQAAGTSSEQLSYHAVNGIRVRKLFSLLGSKEEMLAQFFFLVCDETSRTLAHYFQRASEGQLRMGRPFAFDMASSAASPIVVCLQYFSGLVSGGPPNSRLVWQMGGHSSMAEWVAQCPTDAATFRRTCLAEASKTKRRHGHFLRCPFALIALEDDRSSQEYKEQVMKDFESLRACCARPGLAQELKKKGVDMRRAESRDWLLPFAVGLTMSLGNTERQHAHNKAFCTASGDQSPWDQFVAQSVLHQAQSLLKTTKKAQQSQALPGLPLREEASSSSGRPLPPAIRQASATPAIHLDVSTARRPRSRSPFELFKADSRKYQKH